VRVQQAGGATGSCSYTDARAELPSEGAFNCPRCTPHACAGTMAGGGLQDTTLDEPVVPRASGACVRTFGLKLLSSLASAWCAQVIDTVKRDLQKVWTKLQKVVIPSSDTKDELRNWSLLCDDAHKPSDRTPARPSHLPQTHTLSNAHALVLVLSHASVHRTGTCGGRCFCAYCSRFCCL